jgi:copper chaperone CopZ
MAVFGIVTISSAQKSENKVVCFKSDMTCDHCQNTLTEHLKFEKGVKDLKIDYVSNTVLIEYKEGKNSDDALAKAIEKKGYKAEKISKEEYNKITSETKK